MGFKKSYSIAKARDNLAAIVRDVERTSAVELTRRGKPLAVLLSIGEYRRLSPGKRNFPERSCQPLGFVSIMTVEATGRESEGKALYTKGASSVDGKTGDLSTILWVKLYRYKTTIMALVLFVIGLGGILLGSLIFSEEGRTVGHFLSRDIGLAALVASVLGFAYEYLLREDFNEATKGNLKQLLREHDNEVKQLQRLREAGMTCIYGNRQEAKLAEKFHERWKTIQILETWTGYRDYIDDWIEPAVEQGCKVKILLLNPSSPQAGYRDDALGYEQGYVKHEIVEDLKKLEKLRRKLQQSDDRKSGKDGLKIKVYDATPVIHMYRFDNTWITGIYFNKDSIKSPQFEVIGPPQSELTNARNRSQSTLDFAQQLAQHFDQLWTHKQTISASEALEELKDSEAKKWRQE